LIDPANPTDTAGPATGFLVSNKGCTKLQSTGAGCTTTNPEATFNVPLKCLITVKTFRAAVEEIPFTSQDFKFELKAASLLGNLFLVQVPNDWISSPSHSN
jgi:hypothetical protein